jgi:hypothetical protein
MSGSNAREMANSAREKVQGMWTSLRSMTDEEGSSLSKLKKAAMGPDGLLESNVQSTWENMMKTMFGSCTTGIPHEPTTPTSDSSRSSKSRSCEPSEPLSPSREKEEFFYSQFRAKDHSRAEREQAVSAMRERVQATPKTPERKKPSLSKPFPVSSPARKEHPVPPILVREIAPPPTNRSQSEIAGGISFDDGISCLSAHTLDEMARQDDVRKGRRVGTVRSDLMSEGFETIDTIHSKESSLFSPPFSPARINENDDKFGAPIDLTRGNSRNTYSSKKSNGTKSTRSSQTTEFENAWRQDEQIYWQDVVEQDGGDVMGTPEKRREIMRERVEALKERSRAPSSSRSLKGRESVSSTPLCFDGKPTRNIALTLCYRRHCNL